MGRPGGGYAMASPFSFVRRMFEDMDRLFDDFGMGGSMGPQRMSEMLGPSSMPSSMMRGASAWAPAMEVFAEGDQLVVRAELPGLKKEDIHIDLENDVLRIAGERRDEQREEREGFYRTERSYGRFERAIRVPQGTDPASCDARFEDGVLELRLKMPEEKPRGQRIPIAGKSSSSESSEPTKRGKPESSS